MPNRRLAAAGIAPLACLTVGVTTTHAQDASPGMGLEEVIVTAQRRAESINDVGLSIQAFGAAELEALRVDDVKDLTTVVPSFTADERAQDPLYRKIIAALPTGASVADYVTSLDIAGVKPAI